MTNNAIDQIATLLGRAVATPPLPQIPIHPPRVLIEIHPPRVHIPLLPLPKIPQPMVQISKPLPLKGKPSLPKVQVPRQSRLQQHRGLRYTAPQAPLLQHIQAIQTFHHHVNHIYNNQGKRKQSTLSWLETMGRCGPMLYAMSMDSWPRGSMKILSLAPILLILFISMKCHRIKRSPMTILSAIITLSKPSLIEFVSLLVAINFRTTTMLDLLQAVSLLETKLIIKNSTISATDKGARFLCANLKDHFLVSPMKNPEFMCIKYYKYFPNAIRKQYSLDHFVTPTGYIYIRIKKGMYRLKQAALLAYKHLVNTAI
jgi:predicted transcriptional regulator